MLKHWEELAGRALVAAVVLSRVGGPGFELMYLTHEEDPDEERRACAEILRRGLRPVALVAWTSEGKLETERDLSLMTWPKGSAAPLLNDAKTKFLDALKRGLELHAKN